jgi:3',5'-cyclic AMP phosphodiesterase CpdA
VSTVTWLHISDLHWRESQAYDANVVAQALLRDLANRAEIAPELEHIDFIFATGDIAFASRPEEYGLTHQFFIDLLRTTGVRKSRLFIVPGNHDVDRTAISDDARDIVNMLSSRQSVNRLLDDEVGRAIVMQRFDRYRQFVNGYLERHLPFDSTRYFYVKRRKIGDKRIAILGLNSAWASASDADRHNLFLGERQVRTALKQAKRADIRIALMHHPFEWLRDFDRDNCEPLLQRGCDFVLHGHLHRTGLMRLQAPGSEAMVIGAGACYETREYPNAYNLVHLDFSSGEGTVYLRMYSDKEGGFWTKDLLTYQDAPGEYIFNLPHDWITTLPARSADDAVTVIKEEHEVPVDLIETPPKMRRKQHADYKKVGLVKWWDERGYESNPFAWSNAADVEEDSFSELFQLWHIDPKTDAHLKGMGPTPTLDKVKSRDTSRLVLIYAPGGGGKTFYRRWAARQIAEEKLCALEIKRIGEQVRTPENVTARDLAVCIYDHVCERFSIPKDPSPPEHIRHILKQSDEVVRRSSSGSQGPTRLYVFIDDIHQLFAEQPSGASRNAQVLIAIVELCEVAARRGGGEPLALRMFVPAQLRAPIRNRLGIISRRRIEECLISWSAEHCEDIIERRLDSCWKDGPNTDMSHISRLLTQDTRDELRRWLQRQKGMSPGRVLEVLNRLAYYAYSRRVATDKLIGTKRWKEFSRSSDCKDLCAPDAPYPLGRPASKFPRWLWPAMLLMLSLGMVLYVSSLARGILEAALFASVRLVRGIIAWLASASDWIQAFLLLSALLGSVLFVLWCLIGSARLGRRPDLRECLQKVWQLIRQHLPGGS